MDLPPDYIPVRHMQATPGIVASKRVYIAHLHLLGQGTHSKLGWQVGLTSGLTATIAASMHYASLEHLGLAK